MPDSLSIIRIFQECVTARRSGQLIDRESRQDKEFHFQNWFRARLDATGLHHEQGGRNTYPHFRMVPSTEGYEVKGLAYPGRELNYDCNSQAPSGEHNGRSIYYVVGRYPAEPDGARFPVLDLVVCHGDFLNAHHDYVHKNKSVCGFRSTKTANKKQALEICRAWSLAANHARNGHLIPIRWREWSNRRVRADALIIHSRT